VLEEGFAGAIGIDKGAGRRRGDLDSKTVRGSGGVYSGGASCAVRGSKAMSSFDGFLGSTIEARGVGSWSPTLDARLLKRRSLGVRGGVTTSPSLSS